MYKGMQITALGENVSASVSTEAIREGVMFGSRIAEWSYRLGCISAVLAVIYRLLWLAFGALFGPVPLILPHNFMDLSILLLVISIATNAQALVHREDGKEASSQKA